MSRRDRENERSQAQRTARNFWRAPIRFLFGYDFFISYARADATAYSELLETKLEAAGFATFRDQREISAGERLDRALQRAIRRSRQFVLLDTPCACRSSWVAGEIQTFLRSKSRRLTRIKLRGDGSEPSFDDAELNRMLEGFVWATDTAEAFHAGQPSDDVIEQIVKSFRSMKLRNLMRLTAGTIIAVLLALLIWSVQETFSARRQTKIAISRELVAASMANISANPERSIHLALHATALARQLGSEVLPQAEDQLHQAILRSRVREALPGQGGPVNVVAWSPDGDRLATVYDHAIRVWSMGDLKNPVALASGSPSPMKSVTWSPDGAKLLAGFFDSTVKIWDTHTGKELRTCRAAGVHAAWRPDGKVVGAVDGGLNLLDPENCSLVRRLPGNGDEMTDIAWSPDGQRIITGSWCDTCSGPEHHSARVWDARTGSNSLLAGHADNVQAVAWSPHGKLLATGSDDLTAKIWDADSKRERLTLSGFGGPVTSIAWSPDSRVVATASEDRIIRIWDAAGGRQLDSLTGHQASVKTVAWSPRGDLIASGSDDGSVRLWQAGPNTEWPVFSPREQYRATIWSVAWSPDGMRLLTGSQDAIARVWDLKSGMQTLTLSGHSPQPFDADIAGVMNVAWSPDASQVATAGADGLAKVWDAKTGRQSLSVPGSGDFPGSHTAIMAVAWSPDGKLLATGPIGADPII